MNRGHSVTAIIPARSGSVRFPGKNTFPLLGKSLITYTFEAVKSVPNLFGKIVVSTDCPNVARIACKFGVDTLPDRPRWLCTSEATSLDVVRYEIEKNDIHGIVVLLQPTSPLRNGRHLCQSLNLFLQSSARKLLSVRNPIDKLNWICAKETGKTHSLLSAPLLDGDDYIYVVPNGAIYIAYAEDILEGSDLSSKDAICYHMNIDESIDIDTLEDMAKAESILAIRASD